MDIISLIKNTYPDFSKNEKKIGSYVLDNISECTNLTIYDLAERVDLSPSAVTRFIKKMHMESYAQFKNYLIRADVSHEAGSVKDVLHWQLPMDEMISPISSTVFEVCDDSMKINFGKHLDSAIQFLLDANTIFCYGYGGTANVARDFQHKMLRLSKQCIFLEEGNYGLQNLSAATQHDVLLVVSFSGETLAALNAARRALSKDMTVISICRYGTTTLSSISRITLHVSNIALYDASLSAVFRKYGLNIIVDLLYIGMAKSKFESPEDNIQHYLEQAEMFDFNL